MNNPISLLFLVLQLLIQLNTHIINCLNMDNPIQLHETFRFSANQLNRARFYQLRRMPAREIKLAARQKIMARILRRKDIKKEKRFRDPYKKIGPGEAPSIICGAEKMGLAVNENFKGRIFASHREDDPRCVHTIAGTNAPLFTTRFDGSCGVRRVWSSVPSNKVEYHLRVVVSFSFERLTEEDRIFDLTCSYSLQNITLEAYYNTVNFIPSILNASSPSMPRCRYSLHRNKLDGPKTSTARIGEVVYHRWQCPPSEFAFKVYHCAVHNGLERSYQIIDDKGCSLDEEILPNPEYDLENGIVYAPAKAFRFSNSKRVHFNCLLAVCHRWDTSCMQNIPPRCSPRQSQKRKRELAEAREDAHIESRFENIHLELERHANLTDTEWNSENQMIVSDDLSIENDKYSDPNVESQSSNIKCPTNFYESRWLLFLCMSNFVSISIAVFLCLQSRKNKYTVNPNNKRIPLTF